MTDSQPPAAESTPDPDLTGRQLGDYHLLRRLGRGGMAEVYLADQQTLGRQVAFKVLSSRLASDQSYVRRFEREAKSAAALVHANIVQIYEVGCIDGVHFIAQEYVRGQNLRQLLDRDGPVDASVAVRIMGKVAAALLKADRQGIVHRDIKPENILLAEDGELKVADFGLARVIDNDGQTATLTEAGITMGTPLYMSPEQLQGGRLDPRSDLYSLGVTSFQMLAGRPPFNGESAMAIAAQHLKGQPPRLEDQRADLPSGLCRIIHRLLAKQPDGRYDNAAALLQDMRALPIEGWADDWPKILDAGTTAELATATQTRLDATQKLDVVMRAEASESRRARRTRIFITMVVLASLVAGALAAGIGRLVKPPKRLLEVPAGRLPKIERKTSAKEQYDYARWLGILDAGNISQTERAWKAVSEYFPPEQSPENRLYARQAQQRLADLYLREGDLEGAMKQFTELADSPAAEVQDRAYGLAGQAVIHDRRGERQAVIEKLAALNSLRQHWPPQMRSRITRLNVKYRRAGSR